jgi:hypothetical protein
MVWHPRLLGVRALLVDCKDCEDIRLPRGATYMHGQCICLARM